MEDKKLRKFQYILIDEKRTHIEYDGIEEKGPRPYLIVKPNMYGKYFIACPLTDVEAFEKTSKNIRKSYLKIKYDDKDAFVKMNFTMIFQQKLIDEGIAIPIDRHLNKSFRKISIKLLQESFED